VASESMVKQARGVRSPLFSPTEFDLIHSFRHANVKEKFNNILV